MRKMRQIMLLMVLSVGTAPDDLDVAVGADNDPNIEAALTYLDTGGCPAAAVSGMQFKLQAGQAVPQLELRGTPAREFAEAL